MSDLSQRVLRLVETALDEFDDPAVPTSATLRRVLRIATLREDVAGLLWLRLEAADLQAGLNSGDKAEQDALSERVGREHFVALSGAAVRDHFRVRSIDEDSDNIYGGSLEQLEDQISSVGAQIEALAPPAGLHPLDLYFKTEEYNKIRLTVAPRQEALRRILRRSRTRLHGYLARIHRVVEVRRGS